MDKNGPNKEKQKQSKIKKPTGYTNGPCKPYKGPDGYLHWAYCKRRYEPGHLYNKPYK